MDKDYVCSDFGEIDSWNQIKVSVNIKDLDTLVAIMSMIDNNLMIEDYSDIDLKTCYGDLIDEKILNADKSIAFVSLFVASDKNFSETVAFIKERCAVENIDIKVEVVGIKEEDWANSWRDYYKTLRVGNRVVIVPMWEKYNPTADDIVVKMDPGMAFGTGTHETTRLVLELLERYLEKGSRMLDVGSGSGILAICASKLGASLCRAYDIDPVAVKVAEQNIKDNNCTNVFAAESDLLKHVDISDGKYDIITANIVADIIIRMAPNVSGYLNDNGVLLASGIIAERAADVIKSLEENGLYTVERLDDNGWCALALKKRIINK